MRCYVLGETVLGFEASWGPGTREGRSNAFLLTPGTINTRHGGFKMLAELKRDHSRGPLVSGVQVSLFWGRYALQGGYLEPAAWALSWATKALVRPPSCTIPSVQSGCKSLSLNITNAGWGIA